MTESADLSTDSNHEYRIEVLTGNENTENRMQSSESEENVTTTDNEDNEEKENFNSLNKNNALDWFNKNNSNLRSFRHSSVRGDPFHPEFNAFYPMRRSKVESFEFFDDDDVYRYGLTRLTLKMRDTLQYADDYLWSKSAFRLTMAFVVLASIVFMLFKLIIEKSKIGEKSGKVPMARIIIFLLILGCAYAVSFFEKEKKDDDSQSKGMSMSMNVNQSNVKRKLKSLLKEKLKIQSAADTQQLWLKIIRFICAFVTFFACVSYGQLRIGASSCVIIGVLVALASYHPMMAENVNGLLTSLISTLLLCILCFKTETGKHYIHVWFNFVGTHHKLLSDSLITAFHFDFLDLTSVSPGFFHVFYNPFYVGVAACAYHLGFHRFFFLMVSQLGIYFFGVSTVVMGCILSNLFFDYAAYLLWMSPLLAVADDYQIFSIIVSTSCCLPLPMAFQIANRYGMRNSYISVFGPLNACIGIIVCKLVFPTRRKIPPRIDLSLIRKREPTSLFETFIVAVTNSAKFIMLYFGGWVLAHAIYIYLAYIKQTIQHLIEGVFLPPNCIDRAIYYLGLPLLYQLGFDEDDTEIVSKFIFQNLITFKSSTIDEFMHHVSLRWLSECWASTPRLAVDYNSNEVFFKTTLEKTIYLHTRGTILSKKSEFLLLHLLMNYVTVGNIFTYSAIMAILLPHRVINIRSMMGSMFFAMMLTLYTANIFVRIFYNDEMTGLDCVNEKERPMCKEMLKEILEHVSFNGSVQTVKVGLESLCATVTKKYNLFGDQDFAIY